MPSRCTSPKAPSSSLTPLAVPTTTLCWELVTQQELLCLQPSPLILHQLPEGSQPITVTLPRVLPPPPPLPDLPGSLSFAPLPVICPITLPAPYFQHEVPPTPWGPVPPWFTHRCPCGRCSPPSLSRFLLSPGFSGAPSALSALRRRNT